MLRHFASCVGLLGIHLLLATNASAQQFLEEFGQVDVLGFDVDGIIVTDGPLVDVTAKYFKAREVQRDSYRSELNIHLEELDNACQLDARQLKKLRVGIEGVAEKMLAVWEKAQQRQKAARANFRGGRLIARGGDFVDANNVLWATSPPNQSLSVQWRQLSQKVLTKPQQAKWQEAVQLRAEHIRATIVAMVVFEVDKKLLLTPAQREALTVLVNEHAGGVIEKASLFRTGVTPSGKMVRLVPDAALQELLSKSQLAKLNRTWREARTANLPADIQWNLPRMDVP